MATEVVSIEEELKVLEKESVAVDQRLREIETKERLFTNQSGNRKRRQERAGNRGENEENDEDASSKRIRGTSSSVRKGDENGDEHSTSIKPRISSAIANPNPEKQNKAAVGTREDKGRSRKLFGVLVGTLQQFKNDMSKQNEVVQRRQQLEEKIQQKVTEESQTVVEQERKALEEQKEKEKQLKEELKKKIEEKQQELINKRKEQYNNLLAKFNKTNVKPSIYWKPKDESETKKIEESNDDKNNNSKVEKDDDQVVDKERDTRRRRGTSSRDHSQDRSPPLNKSRERSPVDAEDVEKSKSMDVDRYSPGRDDDDDK